MNVIILRGIPGSGKSTFTKTLAGEVRVVSADHFFEKSGSYQFDPTKLPQAHGECLRKFVEALQKGFFETLVVDNTNTSVSEVAPYAALALAYGAKLEIVNIQCDPEVAAKRNIHGVPATGVAAMAKRLSDETPRLPPWWPQRTVGPFP